MATPGMTHATRWIVEGIVNGKPFLVYQKILRLHEDAGADWYQPSQGAKGQGVTHKIIVTGEPTYMDEMHQPRKGLSLTPIMATNLVPFVCNAAPGIHLQQDIPPLPARNLNIAP